MQSKHNTPISRMPGLTVALLREKSYRQVEEDRIREIMLPSVHSNEGGCEISG